MNLGKLFDNFIKIIKLNEQALRSRRETKKKLKKIKNDYIFSKSQYKKIILPYWKQYGIKPKYYWYKLYCLSPEKIDCKYIPNDMWYKNILPHYNNILLRKAYVDKNFQDTLFPKVNRPVSVGKFIDGVYYDNKNNMISIDKLAEICKAYTNLIIKPAIDSGSGRGIKFLDYNIMSEETIYNIIKSFDVDFIIQEVASQHNDLKKLNETSLNTIRVLSFFHDNKVIILSTVIRIGGPNNKVDNIGAGGIQCGIDSNGYLFNKASNSKRQWVDRLPNGIKFSDVKIPSYDKIIDLVKKEHRKLPHFRIIGWDIGVDNNETPILIEFNIHPAQNQMTCGPTFGSLTDVVLDEVFNRKIK